MLYVMYGIDGPDGARIRVEERETHFDYLKQNEGIMVLGGATLADSDDGRTGSVLIINVPNRAAADAFAANEPFNVAGLFKQVFVTRMRRGQWFPDHAPATAEGE
ncbi:MAG: YciI family protein [Rhodospirillaceae bacterium]|jgi:hypothetical protein|nr:YciI family protein [Alphaproteobacteria bacterium]MBT3551103.1 YciI family protein [Rhodospirillaceae bacterium]MBT3887327.1 YciI family protein [Rhodospirillaceae bacterium]MBT4118138.1 YciI family protein [Rhodospirillaceae bacterium]MBT4673601.1 YciI family protein [Rhodospirillaceae bacterium]